MTDTTLDDTYADVLDDDVRETRLLVAALDSMGGRARAAVPVSLDARVRPALVARAADRTRGRRPSRPGAPPRPAFVATLGLLAAALLGGVVYAAVRSAGTQALSLAPDTAEIVQHNLGVALTQARTVCGYGVTLNHAYADAHRIIVAYTLTAPPGRALLSNWPPFMETPPVLNVAPGEDLEATGDLGGDPSPAPSALVPVAGLLLTFATSPHGAHPPRMLHMHLTLPNLVLMETINPAHPRRPCERVQTPAVAFAPLRPPPLPSGVRIVRVRGPLVFTIDVPRLASITTSVQQVVHAGSGVVTVMRLETTPLDTRIFLTERGLRGPRSNRLVPVTMPEIEARGVFGRTTYASFGGSRGSGRISRGGAFTNAQYVLDLAHPYGFHGAWTLHLVFIADTTFSRAGVMTRHTVPLARFHLHLP